MAILNFSTLSADTLVNSFRELLEKSSNPSYLEIYKGLMPNSANTMVDSENLLGKVTCEKPSCAPSSNGLIKINFSPDNHASASGEASWARFCDGNGNSLMDIDISDTSSKSQGLLILDKTNISKGGAIIINSMVFSI